MVVICCFRLLLCYYVVVMCCLLGSRGYDVDVRCCVVCYGFGVIM